MNILTISTYYGRGGAGNIAKIIHQNINSTSNLKGKFLYAFDKGAKQSIIDDKVIPMPYNHRFVPHLNYASHTLTGIDLFGADEQNLTSIIRWADIIHLHIIHSFGFNYEQLVRIINKEQKKVIITVHDSWYYTGRCAIIADCQLWQSGCQKCPNLSYYPSTSLDFAKREFQKKVSLLNSIKNLTFVSPSNWIAENVKLIYPQKSVYTINNGIDTTSYSNLSIRHQKKIEAIKYLFVTNDFKEDVKVDLVFLEKLINTGVEVHLIGANSPFEENNVHNYGYLSDKNKYLSILNNTDVMLFFSTIDNYPTVIIEGLCAGLHIAGYRSKGIEEVTNNFCKNVTFFSSYETFCKIDIVSKLTTEKITTSEEAIKYFSAKKMIKSYLKLYDAN